MTLDSLTTSILIFFLPEGTSTEKGKTTDFITFTIIITPHVCDVSGVIVLTSSVCLLPLSRPNRQTYRLEIWHGGQVEGYLGQVYRSRSRGQRMLIGTFH